MQKASGEVTVEILTQAFSDFGRDMRDFVRQEIQASEHRVKTELRQEIRGVVTEVAEIINDHLLPQLDDHEIRIRKLETSSKLG